MGKPDPIAVAKTDAGQEAVLLPAMANRHGLVTGATGTGKTVTLQLNETQQGIRGMFGSMLGGRRR